ncbi:MAG: Ig-like domain-containing protein [Treponema sp.]|nr:Ig-like domain-containing protein [Treponema sp.]
MLKKVSFFFVFLLLLGSALWAGGRKENLSLTAPDPSGFSDTIDTTNRKPGRSNYYLEAKDRAGNITRSGPENITFDPASDLPNTTIINPVPNMSVHGNMNIVGIAFDDDGISGVEFTVNRGSDGKGEELVSVKAEGTDFWSYFLNTSNPDIWTDGNYSITAWSTDINGLTGIDGRFKVKKHRKAVVPWILDRKKPVTTITSHDIGALVSGGIRLKGIAADGNGINSLYYSTDEGETYHPVKTSLNKSSGDYNWEININTRSFEDGPKVIWFKAIDGNNSVGSAAHLLFINNTGPEVNIVYPEAGTVVNGLFSIAGSVTHPVGLKTISWKAGNIKGDILLLPGNDWWSADIDLRNIKTSSIDIEIRAEDVSGNVTIARQRYKVDQISDLPVVTLTEPLTGSAIGESGIVVKGTASDDDGIASIFYSLNSAPAVEIPATGGYFQFLIPNLSPGIHGIEVWAKDVTGVVGPKIAVRGMTVQALPPAPGIVSFAFPGSRPAIPTKPYYTGMTIKPEPRTIMNVAIRSTTAIQSSSIVIGDVILPLRLSTSKDMHTAAVEFPANQPDGLTLIQIRATDRSGVEVVHNEHIFLSSAPQDSVPFVFSLARTKTHNDGRVIVGSNGEVFYGISSQPIRNVTVSGSGLGAYVDEYGRVVMSALQEGDLGPFTLRLQTDQGAQQSPAFRVLADFSGPVVNIQGAADNAWVRTNTALRFNISSRARLSAVEYSLDVGTTWISMGQVSNDYNRTVDLGAVEDGTIGILVRATSDSGRSNIASVTVLKDSQMPQAVVVMPTEGSSVNGTIRMAFSIEEQGTLQSVGYRRPASGGAREITREIFNADRWEKDYNPRFFEVLLDSTEMPLGNNMRFTFTDKAGNSSDISVWQFMIDQASDVPVVHIILPQENEVITSDFIISGVMFDDDGIKNIQWRLDNGAWQTLDAENGFSLPILVSSLSDNAHSVTVIAEDIYGVRSEPKTRNFRVSLSEPAGSIQYPLYNTVLKEGIEVRGSSSDKNGIKEVLVSLDNGNTYNSARGNFGTAAETVSWTYQFNTTILKDGPNVIFYRVIDRYDIPATYANMINVDNSAPEILLDSPGDGSFSVGNITVMGRIIDANLKDIDIQLRSLDGANVTNNLRSRKLDALEIIRESFDLTPQTDGNYNIAVIATDLAGNVSRISRNFQLVRQTLRNTIEILYPLENEEVSGNFNLYGIAQGANKAENVTLRINGRDVATTDVDDTGYFRFSLDSDSEALTSGTNNVIVHSNFGTSTNVQSRAYAVKYTSYGPWVTIDSFKFGDFAYNRPYIFGRTGYILNEEDKELLADKSADKNEKNKIKSKVPDFTEISFDNGRTFRRVEKSKKKGVDYRYRLETGEMTEGNHYIIIRTTMKNREIALSRMLVQVDKTFPEIRLISPEAGGVYNQSIGFSATATDDVELVSLTYHLRKGDKSAYEIPGFLQGLYIEGTIPPFIWQLAVKHGFADPKFAVFSGGATYFDVALGLSFFDDNVKIQAQYGYIDHDLYLALGGEKDLSGNKSRMRYGGHVIGVKLLANIYTLPFGIFGPDWEWLYASFGIGAIFSYFDFMGQEMTQSKSPTWLSALLLQIEFPKISVKSRSFLRTFSMFTEGQLWFIPKDVKDQPDVNVVMPKLVLGVRMYIF